MTEIQEKSRAPAVDKIIKIMDLLADSAQPLAGADIAKVLGLARSSVHVLLAALEQADVVCRTDDKRYTVGMRTVHWAGGYLAQQDIVSAFYQCLDAMPALDRYTLTLSALEGDKVVYLACKNSTAPLGFTFRLGMQAPAVFTATGKALLSTLPDAEIKQRIRRFPPAETEASVQEMPALLAEMQAVRAQGYAVDNGQLRRGMHCFGVGIGQSGQPAQYGIAVSLVEAEADSETVAQLVAQLQRLAAQLEGMAVQQG